MRILLNNIRYGLMDNKLKGEDLLRQSGAKYTIIRPGGLTSAAGGKEQLKISEFLAHLIKCLHMTASPGSSICLIYAQSMFQQ